jgi:hypothetical protein
MAANSEGTKVPTWGYKKSPTPDAPAESFRADVQSKTLTEAEVELYGIDKTKSDAKVMYFDQSLYAEIGNRAYVVSDFPGEAARYFDIKGSNRWQIHGEAILVPVVGE